MSDTATIGDMIWDARNEYQIINKTPDNFEIEIENTLTTERTIVRYDEIDEIGNELHINKRK